MCGRNVYPWWFCGLAAVDLSGIWVGLAAAHVAASAGQPDGVEVGHMGGEKDAAATVVELQYHEFVVSFQANET
jgi:hypothetical protein